jgi:hypothetical protein
MKCLRLTVALLAMVLMLAASCATKRDCQGVKHTRQKNGIYL